MATYEEVKSNISAQLANITTEQINSIKLLMDKRYNEITFLSDAFEYESFLVKSNIVQTSLVRELVFYAMQLREKKIKELFREEYDSVKEDFDYAEYFEKEWISPLAYMISERG